MIASWRFFGCSQPEPATPPLGVSLREEVEVEERARAASALKIARIETCELPPFIGNDAAGPTVIEDVAYGDDKRQKYDLALPESDGTPRQIPVGGSAEGGTRQLPKALVVIIHGGGWTSGGKSLFRPTIRMLASLGYAAASVGYRLASDSTRAFPAGLADVRCAIRAVRNKAGVAKTVLLGASAGGHLAAMVATMPDAPQYDRDCSDKSSIRVDGAVLYYAPLELDRARERYVPIMRQAVDEFLFGARTVAMNDGGGVDEDASDWMFRAREATPSHEVGPHTAPMLLLNGGADLIAPLQDARDFANALAHAGVPSLVVELPDQKHGFPVLGRKPEVKPASCSMLHFLEQIAAL